MRHKLLGFLTIAAHLSFPLHSDEGQTLTFETAAPEKDELGISVNFEDVSILEFLRFVSKIAGVNFIYDEKLLNFNISLVTGKPTNPENILKIMIELLEQQGIKTEERGDYFVVERMEDWELTDWKAMKRAKYQSMRGETRLVNHEAGPQSLLPIHKLQKRRGEFQIYKLRYHQGGEIQETIKRVAADLKQYDEGSPSLLRAISSMQWVQSTNSLVFTGPQDGTEELTDLIQSLDVPQKQIFIEVLVIETDVKNLLDFGLEWGGGGKYRDKFGYGTGNFPATPGQSPFAKTLQSIDASNPPTGTNQFPIGRGFDLGVIGDVILHKGATYFSLGSLVSALEADGNSTIILNQKIITQDNKLSHIFVGDNLPFTGSVVTNTGNNTVQNANIEYRDVGVTLNITPLMGDTEVITLDITQEITEAIDQFADTNGIRTTKTDMQTQAHVPDKSFLVLSGMVRNTKKHRQSGIPCLGGLPLIGAAFSKNKTEEEKRNVIVFVRPQIIHNIDDYNTVTVYQENQFRKQAGDQEFFQRGLDMVKQEGNPYGTHRGEQGNLPRITAERGDKS
ncbi:secretin N-terminal domain-containing protein [Simkania negevensis]|nr:secretin N-terminal domain-containing protein [Simkania negevensis]